MAVLLVLAFLALPVIEIYVIIQVGEAIGALPTVALLVAESMLGAWIIRREGRRAWDALRSSLTTGRMPSRELTDAALVLAGGVLLLTPGFVTDAAGFLFVLPFTRPLVRRPLALAVTRRLRASLGSDSRSPHGDRHDPTDAANVVRGKVVEDDER